MERKTMTMLTTRIFALAFAASISAGFAMGQDTSRNSGKLRVGVTTLTIKSNGCVAIGWAYERYTDSWIANAVERHVSGEIEPSQINTPLMVAIARENFERTYKLIDQDVDLDETNERGCTALIWAAGLGREAIFERLLEAGANVSLPDAAGRTPLMVAARRGSVPMVESLLRRGADVNTAQTGGVNEVGETALMKAAWKPKNTDVLRLLVDNGARLDSANEHGRTALMMAAWAGKFENVKFLVEAGADISAKSNKGTTALEDAMSRGRTEVIEYLKDR